MYFPKAISLMIEILVNRLLKSSMFLISKLYFHRYHCWSFYNTKFCVEVTMCMFLFIIQLWNKSEAIFIWHFYTKEKKKKLLKLLLLWYSRCMSNQYRVKIFYMRYTWKISGKFRNTPWIYYCEQALN